MRVVIFGAGAVGSLFAAYLDRAGHSVLLIGRADHVAAVRANGLRVTGRIRGNVPGRCRCRPPTWAHPRCRPPHGQDLRPKTGGRVARPSGAAGDPDTPPSERPRSGGGGAYRPPGGGVDGARGRPGPGRQLGAGHLGGSRGGARSGRRGVGAAGASGTRRRGGRPVRAAVPWLRVRSGARRTSLARSGGRRWSTRRSIPLPRSTAWRTGAC